jgi:diacylglycerol kinase (ATP)
MRAWSAAFRNSWAGLRCALRTERAVRQEALALVIAIPAALVVGQTLAMRALLIAVVMLVLVIELLNTCVEKLCDHVTPERHPQIKNVKDIGSAAVLMALVLAALIWLAALAERLALI